MKLKEIGSKQYIIGYYTPRIGVKVWTGNLTKEDLSDLHSLFFSIFYDTSQMNQFEETEFLTEIKNTIKKENYTIQLYKKMVI